MPMSGTDDTTVPSDAVPFDQQIANAVYTALHDDLHEWADAVLPGLAANVLLALTQLCPQASASELVLQTR